MWNVRQHGAIGDGVRLDTRALQGAIDACASAGGGRVLLPWGTYRTSTLRLRSGVEVHLDHGAMMLGVEDKDAYSGPAVSPGNRWLHALIVGEDLQNIALTGPGVIDGANVRDPAGEERMRGPHTVLLHRCSNVTLQDVTLRNSGNYAFLFYACEHVRVLNSRFEGGWDGIHYREADGRWNRHLRVEGCQFATGDDSIAGSAVEDCQIQDCSINSSCNGVRLIGPARRWTMSRCRFFGPGKFPHITSQRHNMLAGLNLQPSAWDPRPGPLEDVHVSDVTMDNLLCAFHIVVREGNCANRLTFDRITATLNPERQTASSVESWGEKTFGKVLFRDVALVCKGGVGPDQTGKVPSPPGLDARPLPAWGFFVRNARSVSFERVRFLAQAPDFRPVILAKDVDTLRLEKVSHTPSPPGVEPYQMDQVGRVLNR